jgi:ferrous iron transport protein A
MAAKPSAGCALHWETTAPPRFPKRNPCRNPTAAESFARFFASQTKKVVFFDGTVLTMLGYPFHTEGMMQLSFKRRGRRASAAANLSELRPGEQGVLESLDLPDDVARRLMELGFLPGHRVEPGRSAPGGEPRVYRVDGSEVALRRETARRLILKSAKADSAAPDKTRDSADLVARSESVLREVLKKDSSEYRSSEQR